MGRRIGFSEIKGTAIVAGFIVIALAMGVFIGVEFRPATPPVTYREVQVVSVTVYQTVPTYVTILRNQYYTQTQTETQYYPMVPQYQYYPQYYQTQTVQYVYTQIVTSTRPVRTFHTSYSTTFSRPTTFHTFTFHASYSTMFSRPTTTGIITVTLHSTTYTFTRGHGIDNATQMEAGPVLSAIYANSEADTNLESRRTRANLTLEGARLEAVYSECLKIKE